MSKLHDAQNFWYIPSSESRFRREDRAFQIVTSSVLARFTIMLLRRDFRADWTGEAEEFEHRT